MKKTETRKGGKGQKRKVNNIVVMNETEQKGRIRKIRLREDRKVSKNAEARKGKGGQKV